MSDATVATHRLPIVEDDSKTRERLARALSELGYDVVGHAPPGREAMEAVVRHRPDLVIVSLGSRGAFEDPGMARTIDELYGIPTIYIGDEGGDVESGREQLPASYGFLRMPFGLHQLQVAVNLALRRSRSKHQQRLPPDRAPTEDPKNGTDSGGRSNGNAPEMLWIGNGSRPLASVTAAQVADDLALERRQRKGSEKRYHRLFHRASAGAFEATLAGKITDANSALVKLLGYESPEDLLERSLADLVSEPATSDRLLERLRQGRTVVSEEMRLRTKNDAEVIVLLCTNVVRYSGATGRRVVGMVMDITELKRQESDLARLAFEDPLTGVANRRAVEEHAARYLALAERHDHLLGLIYLDVAGFKEVNDRFGHPAGDAILVEVARRLEGGAREGDVVGRVGGDEFLVLLPNVADVEAVMNVARRMDRELEAPVALATGQTTVRADMGISVFPDHGSSLEELIAAADRAMYRAKVRRKQEVQRRAIVAAIETGTDSGRALAPAPRHARDSGVRPEIPAQER